MKKWTICLSCAALMFFAVSNQGLCAPGKTMAYLMAEKVSMLDFGLYKMYELLGDVIRKAEVVKFTGNEAGPFTGINQTYDWDKDVIVVEVVIKSNITAQDACKRTVDAVRNLGTGRMDTATRAMGWESHFSTMFQHIGYRGKHEPSDLASSIFKKVEVHVLAFGEHGQQAECRGKLSGDSYLFVEE